MKFNLLPILCMICVTYSCTKEPSENTEIEIPSTYTFDHLSTEFKYYHINNSDFSLSEISETNFFGGDSLMQFSFHQNVEIVEAVVPNDSFPSPYIKTIAFNNATQAVLNAFIQLPGDSIDHPLECTYSKINSRVYKTDFCMDEFAELTFYFDNDVLSQYSQVILVSSGGGKFNSSVIYGEYSSQEDIHEAFQTYFENHSKPGGENIAIAHIKRNYRKI